MKNIFESLSVVFGLLIIVWLVGSPQEIIGQDVIGGCPPCSGTQKQGCRSRPGQTCVDLVEACTPGDDKCMDHPSPNSCNVDKACVSQWNQSCN